MDNQRNPLLLVLQGDERLRGGEVFAKTEIRFTQMSFLKVDHSSWKNV